jgi:hypothetical protein
MSRYELRVMSSLVMFSCGLLAMMVSHDAVLASSFIGSGLVALGLFVSTFVMKD